MVVASTLRLQLDYSTPLTRVKVREVGPRKEHQHEQTESREYIVRTKDYRGTYHILLLQVLHAITHIWFNVNRY